MGHYQIQTDSNSWSHRHYLSGARPVQWGAGDTSRLCVAPPGDIDPLVSGGWYGWTIKEAGYLEDHPI